MSIYKKFTAQDIAVIPFNAHKQYDFTSGSASSNSINHFNTRWTSESIDLYSSGSTTEYGLPADSINTIKYYQTDHLFYKNFKRDIGYRFGNKNYLKQQRDLYENANVLSIPTGLYGYEIKPGTFSLLSNGQEIVDDSNGNLIIKNTNVNNYPIDVRSNLFRLDPIGGFKRKDINVFEGYHNGVFYLDGKKRVNILNDYSSPPQGEFDDSYYFNPIKYENVLFGESSLGSSNTKFSNILFDSFRGSRIISPDSEKFNFNKEDDFSISFNMKPNPPLFSISSINTIPQDPVVGQHIGFGTIFHVDDTFAYVVMAAYPITFGTFPGNGFPPGTGIVSTYDILSSISTQVDANGLNNLTVGSEANDARMLSVGFGSSGYVNSSGINGPFGPEDVPATASNFDGCIEGITSLSNPPDLSNPLLSSSFTEPLIGGGETNTQNILNFVSDPVEAPLFNLVANGVDVDGNFSELFLINNVNNLDFNFWIANYDEINLINQNIGFTRQLSEAQNGGKILLASNTVNDFGFNIFGAHDDVILTSNFLPEPAGGMRNIALFPFIANPTGPDGNLKLNFSIAQPQINVADPSLNGDGGGNVVIVGKFNYNNVDRTNRYLVSKSTTKTVVSTPEEGQAQRLKTSTSGALQFKDVNAEPQYPFEIYHSSNSIYFKRSDGNITTTVSGAIENFLGTNHILCQKTGSTLEIYVNGTKIASGSDNTNQCQNNANLYIGSKGNKTYIDTYLPAKGSLILDAYVNNFASTQNSLDPGAQRFFKGSLGNINIFDRALTSEEINNVNISINGSPYIGNIFYQNGFATITHPNYQNILSGSSGNGTIERLKFQGSHLIYENEYRCTIGEEEFNDTLNISARKVRSHQSEDLANFATGSLFKPYITTVGLYNENNELLVVGKLGQPLRISDETDSTIIVRWDT